MKTVQEKVLNYFWGLRRNIYKWPRLWILTEGVVERHPNVSPIIIFLLLRSKDFK